MKSADVIVAGAGPAGSSVAYALARAGLDVLVLDRARFPRSKPCAEYLSPEASRILADMGALERVEQSGAAALVGVEVRSPNGAVLRGDFAASHGFRAFRDRGLSVRREVLDAILVDRARIAGARVLEGVHVVDLERNAAGRVAGVEVRTEGETTRFLAPLVIGADGLRSVVARRARLARIERWPKRLALVTHYRGVRDVGDVGEMHVERDGYIGIADVGDGVTTTALVVPASRAREIAGDKEAFFERWLAARPHLVPRFAGAVRVSPVVATGPFAARARHAWVPGCALVGDAADFFDPFTGEGIYAALRGGELLAGIVADAVRGSDRQLDRALASYDAARRSEFGGKWLVERIIGAVVASPRLMNRAARRLAARKDLADLLIGVTGNFVPPREVIGLGFLWGVFGFGSRPRLAGATLR